MILETSRLLLRPWVEEDAAELYRYASDPRIGPAAGWPAHSGVQESRDAIAGVLSEPETYAMVLRETGLPIGAIGLKLGGATDLTDRADECELGYWVGVPYWGQGLVAEAGRELIRHAFEDLGMRAIWCAHYEGNEQSARVQQKLGFVPHHVSEGVGVPLLGEVRTGYVSRLISPALKH